MLKKILLGLLGVIVLLVIVGFFLPGKIEVTRSISVNAPADYVFEEINDLERWQNWSYWNTLDPQMKIDYSDNRAGTGAFYAWDGPEVGKGKLTITESTPYKSIKADLDFIEHGVAKSWYTFEPEGENTNVTMGFSTDFGMNPIGRWMGATMMKSEMNKAFDYNLSKIKEIAEAKPKFSVNISEEDVAPIHFIGISHTMSPKDPKAIGEQMGKMYGELMGALKKAKVEPAGHPFCIFPKYTEESMDMVCALPVAADTKLPTRYKVMKTPGGKTVKGTHQGAYDKLETTHHEINKYIESKKLEIGGAPWEVYITDPGAEPDTTKWVTEVYYPIKD